MITVFSTHITNRLRYIFELIFEDLLGVPVSFTDKKDVFEKEPGVKLNYSVQIFNCGQLDLRPHSILFDRGLTYYDLETLNCGQQLCFFPSSADSFLPFDPFAASFFLVTRYEEYLERQFGKHRRYPAKHSILVRTRSIERPVVNGWAKLISEKIREHDPKFPAFQAKFNFLTTIDVDNAWAFRNKSVWRLLGANLRSAMRGDLQQIKQRVNGWSGSAADPYDTYDYIRSCYQQIPERLHFFFLLGKSGLYDRNVSPRNPELQDLIRGLNRDFKVGLHPSYASNRKKSALKAERDTLAKIVGHEILASRQHYLKLLFPATYRRLQRAGIREDYTLGYSECVGFRAGIASPFYFYDLVDDYKTNLKLFPFQSMDVTLRDYLGKTPEEAIKLLEKMMLEVKECGGTFISLWHNESLSDSGKWTGWRQVFEAMTEKATALTND